MLKRILNAELLTFGRRVRHYSSGTKVDWRKLRPLIKLCMYYILLT